MSEARGFSLVEVILALFLMGIGLVFAAPMFVTAVRENASGADLGSVGALAVDRLERLRAASLAIFALAMGGLGILRQPMAIAPTLPPSSSARLGLFRNLEQPESPFRAIRIRKDPRTGRWWVGDGHNPVLTEPPPAQIDARRLVNLSLTPVDLVSPEQSSPEDRVAPGRGDGAHLP